jgi:hypothetical protein
MNYTDSYVRHIVPLTLILALLTLLNTKLENRQFQVLSEIEAEIVVEQKRVS